MTRKVKVLLAIAAGVVLTCLSGTVVFAQSFRASYLLVVPPAQLAGRIAVPEDRPADGLPLLVDIVAEFASPVLVHGRAYGTPGQSDYLILATTETNGLVVWGHLGKLLKAMDKHGLSTDGLTEVPAGPFGGDARCGESNAVATCVWADHGTVAIFQAPLLSVDELSAEFLTIRHGTETDGGKTYP